MGDPATPTAADRASTRLLAARVVQSVVDDAVMPLGLDDCHDRSRPLYHHSDVEDLVMQLCQELLALQTELRDALPFALYDGPKLNERYGRYMELCESAGVQPWNDRK